MSTSHSGLQRLAGAFGPGRRGTNSAHFHRYSRRPGYADRTARRHRSVARRQDGVHHLAGPQPAGDRPPAVLLGGWPRAASAAPISSRSRTTACRAFPTRTHLARLAADPPHVARGYDAHQPVARYRRVRLAPLPARARRRSRRSHCSRQPRPEQARHRHHRLSRRMDRRPRPARRRAMPIGRQPAMAEAISRSPRRSRRRLPRLRRRRTIACRRPRAGGDRRRRAVHAPSCRRPAPPTRRSPPSRPAAS